MLSINTNESLGLMLFFLGCLIIKLVYFSMVFGITFILKPSFPASWKIGCES